MFSIGHTSVTLDDITSKVKEIEILHHYLGVSSIPCVICSPLREDRSPSFGIYSKDGNRIFWTDFATKEGGGVYDLLGRIWNCSFEQVLNRINNDILLKTKGNNYQVNKTKPSYKVNKTLHSQVELKCRIREWRQYDLDYWGSYGISIEWLKYAEIYPITNKIIVKNNKTYILGADKYAYAFVEHKEGKTTIKIYQPFNKNGYKWSNKHDRSVLSLWTKIPKCGDKLCICSSMKDALCLWANTGIPAIAVQGEGYNISKTALDELKRRFTNVYILFDNDEAGLKDGKELAQKTGLINLVLPEFKGGKDISDLYKVEGKVRLTSIINNLLQEN